MRHDDLDRILSKEEEILPSSGFTASIMEAVRREAAAPPPIPFPWKPALPGLIVSGLALVWAIREGVVQVIRGSVAAPLPTSFWRTLTSITESGRTVAAGWIVLVLLLSFVSVKFSMRLVRGKL
jgi:hypothetical protein